jgi:hypothetical protein
MKTKDKIVEILEIKLPDQAEWLKKSIADEIAQIEPEQTREREKSNRGYAEQISNILNMDLGMQKTSQATRKRLTNELTELLDEGNDALLFEFATWLSTECPPVVFDIEELIKQFKNKYK